VSTLLGPELLANIGRQSPPQCELVTRKDIRKYAIATGQRARKHLDGDVAPPMFYLALFWPVQESHELSPDGVAIDKLLPEFPLKKAMAGGLRIEYHQPIHPGDELTATRTLTRIYEKQGSSGPLIFYEIEMRVENARGERVVTEFTTRILR
jgi:hydroxyacyl-ACP dehydratase HTD2-like protein with hotdog domain